MGSRGTDKNRMGFWTLTLALGVPEFLLCFAEEIGLEMGSTNAPKLVNILIKTFFLP